VLHCAVVCCRVLISRTQTNEEQLESRVEPGLLQHTLQHMATPYKQCNTGWKVFANQAHSINLKTPQPTTTHCNTLQHTATQIRRSPRARLTASHTATHCNTLQHTATHFKRLESRLEPGLKKDVLRAGQVCCSVLQGIAVCCSDFIFFGS